MKRLMKSMAVIVAGAMATGAWAADKPATTPPDFTAGGVRDKTHDWLLGPTGLRGWMFFRHEDKTATSRQILVTAIEGGSPADGILATNDVILGVEGKPFAADARKSFAHGIAAAEAKDGVLRLIRWRAGQTVNVELKLQVLGAYSDTAPYDCPKSKKIFEQGCQLIAKSELKKMDIPIYFNALALLASGKEEYRPMLADFAKRLAASLKPEGCWYYANGNLFLAEYVLATGDQAILAELKRTTLEVANGQCVNGMWGHRFAHPDGHSYGYGGMNMVGVPMTVGLVLARQAGVADPALDRAIDRSTRLLRWYVNKGAIPYGDHAPWPGHDDNGKCSSATVLFDLLGDREAVSFFSRMATAAYDEREQGHCGNFWNMLWALPGVSRGGPLATGAYLKEQSWYYDLARNWKGGFVYQEIEAGDENNNYNDWDVTGAYLMSFGLPLKSLYMTGKKPSSVPVLDRNEVKEVIAAGRDVHPVNGKNGYDQRTTDALLAGLSSWSPTVRKRSAQALGRRDGDFVPALLKLLAGSDHNARYGACEALRCLRSRSDAAAPQLRALLKDPDPWMVSLTCNTITGLSPAVRKDCVIDLLELAARSNPNDPRGTVNRAVAAAVFDPNPDNRDPGILQYSLEGVDRSRLYPAMEALLQNDAGIARFGLAPYLKKLTDRDLAVLLPAIVKAVATMPNTDEMFADGIRVAGLDLLSRRHIREGMALCVSTIEWRWGCEFTWRMEFLKRYGVHAREVLPQLKEKRPESWREGETKTFEKLLGEIEACTNEPKLVSLKEFIATASEGGDASRNAKKETP